MAGGCIIYVCTGFLFAKLSVIYRENVFADFAERSSFMVAAIKRFEREQGHAPENLPALVPDYLLAVPGTDIGAYSSYGYQVGNNISLHFGRPWILYVAIPGTGSDRGDEKFMYLPDQDYPGEEQAQVIQRLGDWAFVQDGQQ